MGFESTIIASTTRFQDLNGYSSPIRWAENEPEKHGSQTFTLSELGSEHPPNFQLKESHSVCGSFPSDPRLSLTRRFLSASPPSSCSTEPMRAASCTAFSWINTEIIGRAVGPKLGNPEAANLIIRVCNCNSAITCCGVLFSPLDIACH